MHGAAEMGFSFGIESRSISGIAERQMEPRGVVGTEPEAVVR